MNPKCILLKGEERTEEVPSPRAREPSQRRLPMAADISAPEARVEADAEYFFTFEKFLDGFDAPIFLEWPEDK